MRTTIKQGDTITVAKGSSIILCRDGERISGECLEPIEVVAGQDAPIYYSGILSIIALSILFLLFFAIIFAISVILINSVDVRGVTW